MIKVRHVLSGSRLVARQVVGCVVAPAVSARLRRIAHRCAAENGGLSLFEYAKSRQRQP